MTTDGTTSSLGSRIVRASVVIACAHVLFKLAGLLQAKILGTYLDPRTFECAYYVPFQGCIFSLFLIGEKMVGPTFLPVFMRELDTRDERTAWKFVNALMTLHLIAVLCVVLVLVCFPELFIRLLTAWTPSHSPEKYEAARHSLRVMAPALICLSLGSTSYMILNGYKRFFLAALGNASFAFCVFFSVLIGMGLFGFDQRTVVFGVLAGSVAKLATHLVGMTDKLKLFRPSLAWRNPALRSVVLLMLPLVGGVVFARVRDVFNKIWVFSVLQQDGLIQANSFGGKLYESIGWLVPYTLSIAIFPFLCELADRNDHKRMGELLSGSARMLLSVFVPAALVCVVLARPAVDLIFRGGKFGDTAVHLTAVSMACQTLVLPAYALEYLMMQAFFAERKMVAITLLGIASSLLSMVISYVGLVPLGMRGAWALATVALGFALARSLKAVVMIAMLKRNIPFFPPAETAWFLLRLVMLSALSMAFAYAAVTGCERFVLPGPGRVAMLARLAAGGMGAAAGFAAGIFLFRVREPREMFRWTLERARGKLARRGTA